MATPQKTSTTINSSVKKDPEKKGGIGKLFLTLFFLILAAALTWNALSFYEAKKEADFFKTPSSDQVVQVTDEEVQALLDEIGTLIILPSGEEPMVATIEKADELKASESFYENAIDGDKLLVYSDRAILYSPSRKVIANVGPIYYEDQSTDASIAQENPITVDIRNGSEEAGKASAEADIIGGSAGYEIVNIGNAISTDYEGVTIINISGVNTIGLEDYFGVETSSQLPEGEAATDADVVVILGN